MSDLFKVHKLNEVGMNKAKDLATDFEALLQHVESIAADPRALALAKTHLELACIYAKKSMAMGVVNQVTEHT